VPDSARLRLSYRLPRRYGQGVGNDGATGCYTAMLAASPPVSAQDAVTGWQPIETAPKDGSKIDLWVEWEGEHGSRYANSFWSGSDADGWNLGGHAQNQYVVRPTVTHWRPLPVSPALQAAAKVAK